MCCDRENRYVIAVTVEETVDQMQISRSATTCAHSQFSGLSRLSPRSERGDLLVTGMHPLDGAHAVQAVGQSI